MSTIHSLKLILLAMTTAVNTDQAGHVFQLVPSLDASQTFKVHTVSTQSETGVSDSNNPITATVHIEQSPDNTNWSKVQDPITTSADGTLQALADPPVLLKYIRVRTVLTGPAKPKHKVQVLLLSNRRFEFKDLTANGKLTPAS